MIITSIYQLQFYRKSDVKYFEQIFKDSRLFLHHILILHYHSVRCKLDSNWQPSSHKFRFSLWGPKCWLQRFWQYGPALHRCIKPCTTIFSIMTNESVPHKLNYILMFYLLYKTARCKKIKNKKIHCNVRRRNKEKQDIQGTFHIQVKIDNLVYKMWNVTCDFTLETYNTK